MNLILLIMPQSIAEGKEKGQIAIVKCIILSLGQFEWIFVILQGPICSWPAVRANNKRNYRNEQIRRARLFTNTEEIKYVFVPNVFPVW